MGERRTLGRFVCGERVTGGPLGELHRARVYGDAGFEKDFALLLVDGKLAEDRNAMGRLVRAANCWARLSHPRIARAHELAAEGDLHYLVSDWVRGASLGALLTAEGPLPIEAALLVVIDVVDVLAHAHGRNDLIPGGILHLGLSPETILVDGEGRLFVRDFGLLSARIAEGWADDDALVPTLRYAAPELHALQSPIDGRADVFSLGAVLFELLAGRPAFAATKARDVVAEAELSPPSLTSIPAAAGPLVARMLAARAAGRLPSLAELRAQAESLLGDRLAAARALLAGRAQKLLPVEIARPSLLDAPAPPPSRGLRAPSLADDFFAAAPGEGAEAAPPPVKLPPPPSLLGTPAHWGGRPLLPPPTPMVWDPPSTTATTTLEALRRQRRRGPLRALLMLALLALAGVGAWLGWQRLASMRPGQMARMAAHERAATAPPASRPAPETPSVAPAAPAAPVATPNPAPAPAAATTNGAPAAPEPATAAPQTPVRVTSRPSGAQVYLDHHLAGTTPLVLPPVIGAHTIELVADGYTLYHGPLVAGAAVDVPLQNALLPATLVGETGLKLVCRHAGVWRVLVDGADTGRSCPVEQRIPIRPGTHQLTLYAPASGRTFTRPITVHDRGSSTRILLEDPAP